MSGWGWALMTTNAIAFWVLVVTGIVAVVHYARTAGTERGPEPPAAEQTLADRYARGEIDEAEYRRRLDTLDETSADRTTRR